MGIFESLLAAVGLAGAAYFTVYYIIPYMQQQSLVPYYMMQAFGQQQQYQAPAPAPIQQQPLTQDATLAPTPAPECVGGQTLDTATNTCVCPEGQTFDIIEQLCKDEESSSGDGGGSGSSKEEDSNKKEEERRKSAEEDLKKSYDEQKKKRAEYDKDTDPKKDTRYKGKTSREAGREAARKFGFPVIFKRYGSNIRFFVQDEYDRYWEI